MGFDFTGHVLRAPRSAPSNQPTTSPATNGVVRDIREPPTRVAAQPELVDLHADQYRAAVLEAPGTTQVEYLVWAANSSNLAILDGQGWEVTQGTGRIPTGNLTVDTYEDGASRIVVLDDGGRNIGSILNVVIIHGETLAEVSLPATANDAEVGLISQDADAGLARLSTAALAALGGGLSRERGDRIGSVTYTLAPCRFWWTRNDRYETRFGWNGELQRWAPYRGTTPKNLGTLEPVETVRLDPLSVVLPVNSYLDGDPDALDTPATIRVGLDAGATSVPVRVKVVPNEDVATFEFPEAGTDAVLGRTDGTVAFDPAFVAVHAGKTIWYSYKGFREDGDGRLGKLLASVTSPLFLAPVPGPDDHPFIRIGTRRALIPVLLPTDAAVTATDPDEGSVVISLSTGRIKLSQVDIDKANPDSGNFDKLWIGAVVYYDGVALNTIPQPVRNPATLINEAGDPAVVGVGTKFYIPEMLPFPDGMGAGETYRGLGVSGVLFTTDMTGAVPDNPDEEVPVRPGGDTLGVITTGRIRAIDDGVGEMVVFSRNGASETTVVVARDSDLPPTYKVKNGQVYISRQRNTIGGVHTSRVQLGVKDLKRFKTDPLYFMQASLTPAIYTQKARVVSRSRLVFRFASDQILYFAIGAQAYTWEAPLDQEFYNAAEVAQSIVDTSVPPIDPAIGRALAIGDRVAIEAVDLDTGVVEIGWGNPSDLSGAAVLGFLPGWRAEGGKHNWLFDSGVSFGMSRSLLNLRRDNADADYVARDRVEELVLQARVQPNPFVFMDRPPLEDVAGYDEGVFFNIRSVLVDGDEVEIIDRPLKHFEDILHGFGDRKFSWLSNNQVRGVVHQTINAITLNQPSVVPESLLPALGGYLEVSEDGGVYVPQVPEQDYLLPEDGGPGIALLTHTYGPRFLFGTDGVFTKDGTTFTVDATSTPPGKFQKVGAEVEVGDRLKVVAGAAMGSYTVTGVTSDNELEVTPAFVALGDRVSWSLFKGLPLSEFDPALVADQVFAPFTHLKEEPFRVRLLSPLGAVPADKTEQATTRLVATIEDALTNERPTSLRFGPVHASEGSASLYHLTRIPIGTIANGSLFVPTIPAGIRLSEGAFTLQVGLGIIPPDPVAFLPDDPIAAGDVEYHPTTGELRFGSQILADNEGADVWFVETFRDPDVLLAGMAELDPMTGDVNLSTLDMATHEGETLYFTEQMIVQDRLDVGVAPITGSVSFRKPLPIGCLVEMYYWEADLEGRRVGTPSDFIEEFLPVFVRREVATRVNERIYTFNTDEAHVLFEDVESSLQVWIGATLQNFGNDQDFSLHIVGQKGSLRFNRSMREHVVVEVTYLILDTLGGERVYTTSKRPMYRPPFFIKKGLDNFGLRSDWTEDFVPGQMLRIGPECFYIKGTQYFPVSDVTRVDIDPPTVDEVGSRAPGRDAVSVITPTPIATHIDPDGVNTPTGAPAGFWMSLPSDIHPFDPVVRNQSSITFQGNLVWVQPGHILEVSGLPLTIAQVTLNNDGTRTTFATTSPFRKSVQGNQTVKVSRRPVYPPEVQEFLGVGPLVATSGHELVLYGETVDNTPLPGRTLATGVDYDLDVETGVVALLGPAQEGLRGGQRLYLYHTRLRQLRVQRVDGVIVQPRWRASGLHVTVPSERNGLLGSFLTATFTFATPDSFYCRIPTLKSFLGEVAREAAEEAKRTLPGGGPTWATFAGTENWQQGTLGLAGERRVLTDKDRVARVFLAFYNQAIVNFEQIGETISGGFVGDRDGKFRFFVGRGSPYPPPGWEDPITGLLNPRLIWARVFDEADPNRQLTFLESDDIVHPLTCTVTNGTLTGFFPDAHFLSLLQDRQRALILNDIDDRLLLGTGRPRDWVRGWPVIPGRFGRMADRHEYSRIFPTRAHVFFTILPGLGSDPEGGDAGSFSYGKFVDGEYQSSWGQVIGQVGNPVLGAIQVLADKDLRPRRARARIWGYFPEGIPANTFGNHSLIPNALVVTPLELAEVPVDPTTGFPNHLRLRSADPDGLPDSQSGHPQLAIPGFQVGDQLAWGKPDGSIYPAKAADTLLAFGLTTLTDLYVESVQFGCVLTFKNQLEELITDPAKVLVGTSPTEGIPIRDFPIERGDTVYVGMGTITEGIVDTTDTPQAEQIKAAAEALPSFRDGFDMVARRDGSIVDRTLPSWDDPGFFPLKELTGQKPPNALEHIEGVVELVYAEPEPLKVPALLGVARDDSGDQRIPYMRSNNTELERFEEVTVGLGDEIFRAPDEFLFDDGEILDAAEVVGPIVKWPATLMTQKDVQPGASDGVANLQPYDLLFVELQDPNEGWQGILSVGDVNAHDGWSWIEPPRFVSQTTPPPFLATEVPDDTAATGMLVRYQLLNYAVFLGGPYGEDPQAGLPPAGCFISEDVTNNRVVISLTDTILVLNDGVLSGQGNLNHLMTVTGNKVTLKLYAREDINISAGPGGAIPGPDRHTDGVLLGTLEMRSDGGATWTPANTGATVHPSRVIPAGAIIYTFGVHAGNGYFIGDNDEAASPEDRQHIILDIDIAAFDLAVSPFFDLTAPGGQEANWLIPYQEMAAPNRRVSLYGFECSLDVDTTAGGSPTAYIDEDRLTFHEAIDLRTARSRTMVHPVSGLPLATSLQVTECEWQAPATFATENNINGGIPLTFVSRSSDPDSANGTWENLEVGVEPEGGSLKVMSLEGDDNTPIMGTSIKVGAAASSIPIVTGTSAATLHTGLSLPSFATGTVADIARGDLLVIKRSNNSTLWMSKKAGSSLVRWASDGTPVSVSGKLGEASGFVPGDFPKVLYFDAASNILELDQVTGLSLGDRVYIPLSTARLASSDAAVFKTALFSANIGNMGGNTLLLDHYQWATSVDVPTEEELTSLELQIVGRRVSWSTSGLQKIPVSIRHPQFPTVPDMQGDHIVGGPTGVTYGVRHLTIATPHGDPLILHANDGNPDNNLTIVPEAGLGLGQVGVETASVLTAETFRPEDAILLEAVPGVLHFNLSDAQWNGLNNKNGHANADVMCLLPNTRLHLTGETEGGFVPVGRIALEPAWPKPTWDNSNGTPRIVDNTHSLSLAELGFTDPGSTESTQFEVRRIRRFGGGELTGNIKPLRYTYEIRRGISTGWLQFPDQSCWIEANNFTMTVPGASDVWNTGLNHTGSQLGYFNSPDVNIHPGDILRVYQEDGTVSEAEILEVYAPSVLRVAAPGLADTTGLRFEVYLRQAPVPHEQTHEQLLSLIMTKEIHRTEADYSTELGGYCEGEDLATWGNAANVLKDNSLDAPNFLTLDVRVGDLVIIDPAGDITQDESGGRPQADRGVQGRTGFEARQVSPFDDNRGFYRVTEVAEDHLVVTGAMTYAGNNENDVVFGEFGFEYAVLPTVGASFIADPGTEGQNDLRPTSPRVGNTHGDNQYSIAPFSYRIIRTSNLFEPETVDLVLFLRERMLSWIEELRAVFDGRWGGDFWAFQDEEHISDLGTLGVVETIRGLFPNEAATTLLGELGYSPFLNTGDCLSLLDRRFWILDARLDTLRPQGGFRMQTTAGGGAYGAANGPFTAFGAVEGDVVRPVLPDRVELILDETERFRAYRYTWLNYRVHQYLGMLVQIQRFDNERPKREAERKDAILLQDSGDKA